MYLNEKIIYISYIIVSTFTRLLIVPYGIETLASVDEVHGLIRLLIVPYGIETKSSCSVVYRTAVF